MGRKPPVLCINLTVQIMINQEVLTLAKKLWNYHQLHHKLERSDCILVLGSLDTRTADRGADIYMQGYAPIIIFSGDWVSSPKMYGKERKPSCLQPLPSTRAYHAKPSSLKIKAPIRARTSCSPSNCCRRTISSMESFIVVQKPYMERRSYATFKKHWPDKKLIVTSPLLSFEEYPN